MRSKFISILMAMMVVAIFSSPSSAQTPDFSICSDQQGAAFGLCRGGVAVGCDVDDSSDACTQIAEQFEQITGSLPPYAGASIAPSSAAPGNEFTITDPVGRIQASDFVVFFEPGKDPAVDGFFASSVVISGDGMSLTGRVPNPIPQGITYSVRVTPDLSTAERFADLDFFVELGPTCPPNCGF